MSFTIDQSIINATYTGSGTYQDPYLVYQANNQPNPGYFVFSFNASESGYLLAQYSAFAQFTGASLILRVYGPNGTIDYINETASMLPHVFSFSFPIYIDAGSQISIIANGIEVGSSGSFYFVPDNSGDCFANWSIDVSSSSASNTPSGASITSNNGFYFTGGPYQLLTASMVGVGPAINFFNGSTWTTYDLQVGDILSFNDFIILSGGFEDI